MRKWRSREGLTKARVGKVEEGLEPDLGLPDFPAPPYCHYPECYLQSPVGPGSLWAALRGALRIGAAQPIPRSRRRGPGERQAAGRWVGAATFPLPRPLTLLSLGATAGWVPGRWRCCWVSSCSPPDPRPDVPGTSSGTWGDRRWAGAWAGQGLPTPIDVPEMEPFPAWGCQSVAKAAHRLVKNC